MVNRSVVAAALTKGDLIFVTSELTVLEALVHAVRDKDDERQLVLREFLAPSSAIETWPVSLQILEDALLLRVHFGLKSPDAIHIATGIARACVAFLTKDQKWKQINLSLLTVSDLVAKLRLSN